MFHKKTIRKTRLYKFIRVAYSHPLLTNQRGFRYGLAVTVPSKEWWSAEWEIFFRHVFFYYGRVEYTKVKPANPGCTTSCKNYVHA